VGVTHAWARHRSRGAAAMLLPGALLVTALWQVYVHSAALPALAEDWQRRLPIWALVTALLASVALVGLVFRPGLAAAPAGAALGVGLAALLVMPAAWALSTVLARGIAVIPSADIGRLAARSPAAEPRGRGRVAETALIAFLRANHHGERFLLATPSAQLASPVIIATGEPVMAMGGFHGLDPILTPERLARLVEERQVRFILLGELSIASRFMGAEAAGRPLADWVRAHGRPVDAAFWGGTAGLGRVARRQLYDLNPEVGLVPASEGEKT
jgi:4-amino-4-deoxy-L-arabinose transferase-like glycosyltransferase